MRTDIYLAADDDKRHVHAAKLTPPRYALLLTCVFCLAFQVESSYAVDNGLGLTPPMGWNSWIRFGCVIKESLIRETAEALVNLGLDQLGYRYINLDDCWQMSRNSTGHIVADSNKFPSGIPALRDYVAEDLGLRFGLYSDSGLRTCQGRPGSF